MSGLDGFADTLRDLNRATSSLRNTARNVGGTVRESGKAIGEIQGVQGTIDETHYKRNSAGDRAHLQANRAERALAADEQGQGQGSGYNSREAYAGSMGFSRQGNTRETPEGALVTAIVLASQHPENPEYKASALAIANNLRGQDNLIHLSGSVNKTIDGQTVKINFGRDSAYSSSEKALEDIALKAGLQPIAQTQSQARFQNAAYTPDADGAGAGTPPPPPTLAPPVTAPPVTTAPAAAPAASAAAEAPPATEAPAASAADANTKTQKELNQEAQLYLERLGHNTGEAYGTTKSNHATFVNAAADSDISAELDGNIGRRSKAALTEEGFDPSKPITAEMVEQLKAKAEAAMAAKRTKTADTSVDAPEASAAPAVQPVAAADVPAPAATPAVADAPVAAVPPAPVVLTAADAAIIPAVKTLTATEAPAASVTLTAEATPASPTQEAKAAPMAQPAIFFTQQGFAPEIAGGVYTPSAEPAKIQQLATAAAPETTMAFEPSSANVPIAKGFVKPGQGASVA